MSGRSKAKLSRWRWERVWDAHANLDFTVAEIAESLGLHHSTITYYLRKGPPRRFRLDTEPDSGRGLSADSRHAVVRRKSAESASRVVHLSLAGGPMCRASAGSGALYAVDDQGRDVPESVTCRRCLAIMESP